MVAGETIASNRRQKRHSIGLESRSWLRGNEFISRSRGNFRRFRTVASSAPPSRLGLSNLSLRRDDNQARRARRRLVVVTYADDLRDRDRGAGLNALRFVARRNQWRRQQTAPLADWYSALINKAGAAVNRKSTSIHPYETNKNDTSVIRIHRLANARARTDNHLNFKFRVTAMNRRIIRARARAYVISD